MQYPYRVASVLCALSKGHWRTFQEIAEDGMVYSALDAKQLVGTLVAMRNRGIVQSRRWHAETGGEVMEWRLHPVIAKMDQR